MNRFTLLLTLILAISNTALALARGMGGGMASGGGSGGYGGGAGIGADSGTVAGSRYRFSEDTVTGWQVMSPEERKAYGRTLRSFNTYGECTSYQVEHGKQMTERAKAQGIKLPAIPTEACERMKIKGAFD